MSPKQFQNVLCREEHKSHSGDCPFLSLKKSEAELTIEEFFRLEGQRHQNRLVSLNRLDGFSQMPWENCSVFKLGKYLKMAKIARRKTMRNINNACEFSDLKGSNNLFGVCSFVCVYYDFIFSPFWCFYGLHNYFLLQYLFKSGLMAQINKSVVWINK